jgi:hypothetical protein
MGFILTAQKFNCEFLSISFGSEYGGTALGYLGEYHHALPPSTIVFPKPNARLTTPSSGLLLPKA